MRFLKNKKGLFEDIKKIILLLVGLIVLILIIIKFGGFMMDIVGGLF